MKLGTAILLVCMGILCLALPVSATTVTSSFVNWQYSYFVTPPPGETVMDFHVYADVSEGDGNHYYNHVMPAGWQFTVIQLPDKVVLTWWTTSNPLPVNVTSTFSFVHYCIPCCHSWFTTAVGTPDPAAPHIDGSWNHPDWPCNIPPEWEASCPASLGGVVAPVYPNPTGTERGTWGQVKTLYR